MIIGSTLGATAGFFGGIVDAVIMRIADLVFAFPGIILALAVAAALGAAAAQRRAGGDRRVLAVVRPAVARAGAGGPLL